MHRDHTDELSEEALFNEFEELTVRLIDQVRAASREEVEAAANRARKSLDQLQSKVRGALKTMGEDLEGQSQGVRTANERLRNVVTGLNKAAKEVGSAAQGLREKAAHLDKIAQSAEEAAGAHVALTDHVGVIRTEIQRGLLKAQRASTQAADAARDLSQEQRESRQLLEARLGRTELVVRRLVRLQAGASVGLLAALAMLTYMLIKLKL